MSIYNHNIDLAGKKEQITLEPYKDKVILIVNVASKCGFTPQYTELEEIYQKYKHEGLVVLGFPCNQFANQEPGPDEDIQTFCKLDYGVSFPVLSKIDVNGENTHPLYKELKELAPGTLGSAIKWNFTKFLIGKNASEVKRYAPITKPKSLEQDIIDLLHK